MKKLNNRDITGRKHIEQLMELFYEEALKDEVIGYIFTDVARLDLNHHLPIICDFWENVLFKTGNYARHGRNPMQVHFALNNKERLTAKHFERWLEIFNRVTDSNFSGENTDTIKNKALFMAQRISATLSDVNTRLKISH